MTIVFESYTNDKGTYADIQQHKGEQTVELIMYQNFGECTEAVYRNTYTSFKDAKRAMHRQYKTKYGGTARRRI